MARIARGVGGTSLVLAPLLAGTGGALAIAARPEEEAGLINTEWGVEAQLADLASIADHAGLFALSGYCFYAAALLAVPALVAVWRLSVHRSPRWAWAAACTAALGVVGQVVHLGYWAQNLAAAEFDDRRAAAEFLVFADGTPFVLATFVPFFFSLLAPVVQAVALRRARVIPLWAGLAIGGAAVLALAMGNIPWSNAVVTAAAIAGFAPAAAAMLRRGPVDAADSQPARVSTAV
jgi:membrane protein YqaA with SNARE-associated domain